MLVPELPVSASQRKLRFSGCALESRNSLVKIHLSNNSSQFLTSGLGTCFWRFAGDTGCDRFVIGGSDVTR